MNRKSIQSWGLVSLIGIAFLLAPYPFVTQAQDSRANPLPTSDQIASHGLKELQGRHLRIITDLPLDDEMKMLPQVFDAAIPIWAEHFGKGDQDFGRWQAVVAIMQDRSRFVPLGFLSSEIPNFKDGYQAGDRLFVVEQPSAYYRRHLLLHEGTHWFMWRLYGGAGPAWFMEGMAELEATHAWDGKRLELNVMPASSEAVPYWGRVKIIKEELKQGKAPSLEAIMAYGNSAHQQVEAYAWSWAATTFFTSHSATRTTFRRVADEQLDQALNRDLLRELQSDWSRVKMEWEGFVSELDYGYDRVRSPVALDVPAKPLGLESKQIEIFADRGWQSTGILVQSGDRLHLKATGRFTIAKTTQAWISEPDGVTLHYVDGKPLGKLLACIASPPESGAIHSVGWKSFGVGSDSSWDVPASGTLMLKVNDRSSDLRDNAGSCQVVVQAESGSR